MTLFTEDQKLSLQAGEFIHSIANHLADGAILSDEINPLRTKLIMELSEILRKTNVCDSDAPLLLAEGFHVSQYPRSTWLNLASSLLDAPEDKPLVDIFKQLPSVHDEELDGLLDEFKNEDISSSSVSAINVSLPLLVLFLFFLFWGEPDVWDSLRNYFMDI